MQSTEKKVYSYNKSTDFVILSNSDAIWKTEEQIRESVVASTDPTSALTSKLQKPSATFRKQQKFETRSYFQLYPFDTITPLLYGATKVHKPEKCYPMRARVQQLALHSIEFLNIL